MRTIITIMLFTGMMALGAAGQVQLQGGNGASLKDIAGTPTLVTVVIKSTGAEDPNLQVVDVGPNYFSAVTSGGERVTYPFSAVAQVRVQGGKVEKSTFQVSETRSLSEDELRVKERAIARAGELFDSSSNNQELKMHAAALLAATGNETALHYLKQLATSNDLQTALGAGFRLFLADDKQSVGPAIMLGLSSGNRRTRANAAYLAGLIQYRGSEGALIMMLRDRSADLAAPAMIASARLGNRDGLPTILGTIDDLNQSKSEAAVYALSKLGGQDVVEQMLLLLRDSRGNTRYRIARVLHELGNMQGTRVLREEMLNTPTLQRETALLLARGDDEEAHQLLRASLGERFDPTPEAYAYRGMASAALMQSGDLSRLSVFQDMLREDSPAIQVVACRVMATMGNRVLITIVQPALESPNPLVAIEGAYAVTAIIDPVFRQRLAELRLSE
jgi:HEAT repeat protein